MSIKSILNIPTIEIYKQLESAYQHFNELLFSNELPPCLITVQRGIGTFGYFSPLRWSNIKGKKTHEIALNPAHFAGKQLIEIFQTLVHEQCHLWQHDFGSPSRCGYHNKEWANKMISIGLMPTSTGKPGGAIVGQKMSDYPIDSGEFEVACLKLIMKGYMFYWVDRRTAKTNITYEAHKVDISSSEISPREYLTYKFCEVANDFEAQHVTAQQRKIKLKVKYRCEGCGANVWGKPSLVIRCEKCKLMYSAVSPIQSDDFLGVLTIESIENSAIQPHM